MIRTLTLAALWLGAMLAGCATLIQDADQGRWIGIEPGSALTLHRPVNLAPSRTRVFFVNGRARNSGANYRTACALEVRRIDQDGPQTIPAGRYRIDRVQNYWTEVADVLQPGSVRFRLAEHDGGGLPMIQSGFHFWFDPADNPNLMRLTCLGALDDMPEAYPPTLQEIAAALGALATLDVATARWVPPARLGIGGTDAQKLGGDAEQR